MDTTRDDFFKSAKIYYLYDKVTGKLLESTVEYDGTVPTNGTTIEPFKIVNGLKVLMQNPTFDKTNQEWIEHPTQQPATPEVKLVAQLGQQVAMIDLNNQNINRKIDMQTKLINDLAQSLIKEQGGK